MFRFRGVKPKDVSPHRRSYRNHEPRHHDRRPVHSRHDRPGCRRETSGRYCGRGRGARQRDPDGLLCHFSAALRIGRCPPSKSRETRGSGGNSLRSCQFGHRSARAVLRLLRLLQCRRANLRSTDRRRTDPAQPRRHPPGSRDVGPDTASCLAGQHPQKQLRLVAGGGVGGYHRVVGLDVLVSVVTPSALELQRPRGTACRASVTLGPDRFDRSTGL